MMTWEGLKVTCKSSDAPGKVIELGQDTEIFSLPLVCCRG